MKLQSIGTETSSLLSLFKSFRIGDEAIMIGTRMEAQRIVWRSTADEEEGAPP